MNSELCNRSLSRGYYTCILPKNHEGWCQCSPYCDGHAPDRSLIDEVEPERIVYVAEAR